MSSKYWPFVALVLVVLLGAGARVAIGSVYGAAEARELLEALSRAGLYLGSAVATGSATTLALMLTMVGMMRRIDKDFDDQAYHNVNMVAMLATGSLMISLIVLLAFMLPVGEFDNLPAAWYETLYNVLFAGCVAMIAMMAATVTAIYNTLRRVLAKITPGEDV